jgi:hypothetical protein
MPIKWSDCKYDGSDKRTDTGVIILGKWDERGKTWGEYRVKSGRNGSNPSNWQFIEGWFQTIGAAMHAAEAHLAWKPDAPT